MPKDHEKTESTMERYHHLTESIGQWRRAMDLLHSELCNLITDQLRVLKMPAIKIDLTIIEKTESEPEPDDLLSVVNLDRLVTSGLDTKEIEVSLEWKYGDDDCDEDRYSIRLEELTIDELHKLSTQIILGEKAPYHSNNDDEGLEYTEQ